MTAAVLAEVPINIREIYETEDRNYLLVLATLVNKVVSLRSQAMKKAEDLGRG